MIIDYQEIQSVQRYKLLSQSVIPRPIAWIMTEDEGVLNIAPFSYFTPLSSDPATVVVSIGHKKTGEQKDTLANILKTKRATICFVNKDSHEQMKLSANSLGKNHSEIQEYSIQTQQLLKEYPPIAKETQMALFCSLYQVVDLPGKTVPVILEVQHEYVDDNCIDQDLNMSAQTISRIGKEFATSQKI